MSMSIKQALKETRQQYTKSEQTNVRPAEIDWSLKNEQTDLSFEDKLNKFKQASEEKMHDLKRNMESKRGSSRRGGSY